MIRRVYTRAVKAFLRFLTAWCQERGRVVHYVHDPSAPIALDRFEGAVQVEEIYLTRYCLWGHMSGDARPGWLRALLPNVYLHCIHRPDSDDSLHNHPWPWGFAIGLLGGYTEQRFVDKQENTMARAWGPVAGSAFAATVVNRVRSAPFFNYISGTDFHRIDQCHAIHCLHVTNGLCVKCRASDFGVWTLFCAGPRAHAKPWGYLVPGRGFVNQEERHEEIGAREVREEGPARGEKLTNLGELYGVKRKRFIFTERDRAYRKRIAKTFGKFWAQYDESEGGE